MLKLGHKYVAKTTHGKMYDFFPLKEGFSYANNLELVSIQNHSTEIKIFIHFPNSKGDFLHEDSDNGKIARGNF